MKVKKIFAAFLIGTVTVSLAAGDKALADSEAKKLLNAVYGKKQAALISKSTEGKKRIDLVYQSAAENNTPIVLALRAALADDFLSQDEYEVALAREQWKMMQDIINEEPKHDNSPKKAAK